MENLVQRFNRYKEFTVPFLVFLGIIFYLISKRDILILATIFLGGFELFKDTAYALFKRQFALDYIAILAIIVALTTGEYLVAGILALMISTGKTLDDFAVSSAKKSLTNLIERIPDQILLWKDNRIGEKIKIGSVRVGQNIFIRKGEVIPLDGILMTDFSQIDESSLTGEAVFVDKLKGDQVFSGTVNMGKPIALKVTRTEGNSTYNKIIELVRSAQEEKSPMVRLTDRYSVIFTIVTFVIAAFAYFYSQGSLTSVLAVLAIATPCPLIIAAPVALLGGMNAAARKRIIVKNLASLESLSRVDTLIFDKTGTITIGRPRLIEVKNHSNLNLKKILGIAQSIERNSLHPLAKAIADFAKKKHALSLHAKDVDEKIGHGISGMVENKRYSLNKLEEGAGMAIELLQGRDRLAVFRFEDELKQDSKEVISQLKRLGLKLYIFTGDKWSEAKKIADSLGEEVIIEAELTPLQKQEGVKRLKEQGLITAMIGDGINDAPALALSDVGLVFSHEEQTAASEAADIVFLGGDFKSVLQSFTISQKTVAIAIQSIVAGIGISVLGMIFASLGFIPPLVGAGLQEVIDVAVILNALRASFTR